MSKLKENIINFIINLQFLFRPSFWLMNDKYDLEWDKELNSLMEKYRFVDDNPFSDRVSRHVAKLGETRIWTANYPYASFTNCGFFCETLTGRPSRRTILKARKKFLQEI